MVEMAERDMVSIRAERLRWITLLSLALSSACRNRAGHNPEDGGSHGSLGIDGSLGLANAGDVDGDGYGDFLVASPGDAKAYLYFGSATPRDDDWNGLAPIHRIDGSGWTASSPSMRRDLLGPDGAGGHFGTAVAQ